MIPHIRASYGVVDNAHALIKCDGDIKLPSELAGLTDRPVGNLRPGEDWGVSVGCTQVGIWWAIWWTTPDFHANRQGMVRSEVALWPIESIGQLCDLRPILCELSGMSAIAPAIEDHLAVVAAALIRRKGEAVVVCGDIKEWPSILAELWLRLWPEARKDFSTRVELSPPSNTGASDQPWVYAVPSHLAPQWHSRQCKLDLSYSTVFNDTKNRAALYLAGREDKELEKILTDIAPKTSDLSCLPKVARIAESIIKLEEAQSFDDALAMLRTLIALDLVVTNTDDYKSRAISVVADQFERCSPNQAAAIANIELPSLPLTNVLSESLSHWARNNIATMQFDDSAMLIQKLRAGEALPWWQSAITKSIKTGVSGSHREWSSAAVFWLTVPALNEVTDKLVVQEKGIERKLFQAAVDMSLSGQQISRLRSCSYKQKWPLLHGWALANSMEITKALDVQYEMKDKARLGLKYILDYFPEEEVFKEILGRDDEFLAQHASSLAIKSPRLIKLLDLSKVVDRKILAQYGCSGGDLPPKYFSAEKQGEALLDAVIDGEGSYGLVGMLYAWLFDVVIALPRRRLLWENLEKKESDLLLPHVAVGLMNKASFKKPILYPEPELAEEILNQMYKSQPSPAAVRSVLDWNVSIDEGQIIRWLSEFGKLDWQYSDQIISRAIRAKQLKRVAESLYHRRHSNPEVCPTLFLCHELLSSWHQFSLKWNPVSGGEKKANEFVLATRLAEVGAELFPEGPDDLWERAGGRKQDLETTGTAARRWRNATSLAARGKLSNGLLPILQELKQEYPENSDLIEFEKFF